MKVLLLSIFLLISPSVFSAAVELPSVSFVYELGGEMSFEFAAGEDHSCGTNIYQINGPTEASLKRKFALVLSAFMGDKKLKVNTEGCNSNRMKVGWIRLLK